MIQTLGVGLNPRIRDLCVLMQIVSDNTATDILCDLVGFANIEARMRSLGLKDIHTPTDCRGLFRRAWGLSMTDELSYGDFKAASRAASSVTALPSSRCTCNWACAALQSRATNRASSTSQWMVMCPDQTNHHNTDASISIAACARRTSSARDVASRCRWSITRRAPTPLIRVHPIHRPA